MSPSPQAPKKTLTLLTGGGVVPLAIQFSAAYHSWGSNCLPARFIPSTQSLLGSNHTAGDHICAEVLPSGELVEPPSPLLRHHRHITFPAHRSPKIQLFVGDITAAHTCRRHTFVPGGAHSTSHTLASRKDGIGGNNSSETQTKNSRQTQHRLRGKLTNIFTQICSCNPSRLTFHGLLANPVAPQLRHMSFRTNTPVSEFTSRTILSQT